MFIKWSIRAGRASGTSRQPPDFGEVPVGLRGAFHIEFFKLFCFVGGQGHPKDYVTEVSSSLGNFHIHAVCFIRASVNV